MSAPWRASLALVAPSKLSNVFRQSRKYLVLVHHKSKPLLTNCNCSWHIALVHLYSTHTRDSSDVKPLVNVKHQSHNVWWSVCTLHLKHTGIYVTIMESNPSGTTWGVQLSDGVYHILGMCSGLLVMKLGVQIPARAEIWIEIFAPPAPPSQLSYDEYTDRTLSVGRWDSEGANWPPIQICQS